MFYNWQKTFSYDAPLSIVVGARGIGKTYGLRKQFVKDYLKDGSRFVAVVRYKAAIQGTNGIQYGYFDKLQQLNEFPNHRFKVEGSRAYIAHVSDDEEKPDWELLGYFVALSDMQRTKEKTYSHVKRIVFDEFAIDKRTNTRYIPQEFSIFTNILSSVIREEAGKGTPARVYLLGNSCDLTNPYFSAFGIRKEPVEGYTWHNGKSVLLHYVKDAEFASSQSETLVGRLLNGSHESDMMFSNEFLNVHNGLIEEKTPNAKFTFGIVYARERFGVWLDGKTGIVYVNTSIPANVNTDLFPIFAMTNADNDIDLAIATRSESYLKRICTLYVRGHVRYADEGCFESFSHVLSLMGIR